jgi:hypothetical protein
VAGWQVRGRIRYPTPSCWVSLPTASTPGRRDGPDGRADVEDRDRAVVRYGVVERDRPAAGPCASDEMADNRDARPVGRLRGMADAALDDKIERFLRDNPAGLGSV